MDNSKVFSQQRMNRCAAIQNAIMRNWQETNSFSYVVRTTDSIAGIDLAELRKRYFSVGVNENSLSDIPFHDMLVVFSMIEQECAALERRKNDPSANDGKDFTVSFRISTEFPDEEAARFVNGIRIETPYDSFKYLRIRPDEGPDGQ